MIAEYDFRYSAVPIVVFVQNDQERTSPNETDDPVSPQPDASWSPIFNLAPYESGSNNYFDDVYTLGVEADDVDGLRDGRHDYHRVDTNTINSTFDGPNYTRSGALQVSYDGSNTDATEMVRWLATDWGRDGEACGQASPSTPN